VNVFGPCSSQEAVGVPAQPGEMKRRLSWWLPVAMTNGAVITKHGV